MHSLNSARMKIAFCACLLFALAQSTLLIGNKPKKPVPVKSAQRLGKKVTSSVSVTEGFSPRQFAERLKLNGPSGEVGKSIRMALDAITHADHKVLDASEQFSRSSDLGLVRIERTLTKYFPEIAECFKSVVTEIIDSYKVFKALSEDPDAPDLPPRMESLLRLFDSLYIFGSLQADAEIFEGTPKGVSSSADAA